jgi:hypothetical protein
MAPLNALMAAEQGELSKARLDAKVAKDDPQKWVVGRVDEGAERVLKPFEYQGHKEQMRRSAGC